MDLAIISDTHLPHGHRALPEQCRERLSAADLIIHAGDFNAHTVLASLRELGEIVAVQGNNDDAVLQRALPREIELEVGGVRIGVVHDAGSGPRRGARLAGQFPRCQLVIFGHSHIPLHEIDERTGFQILNPGSPTDKRRQPQFTMAWARIEGGNAQVEIITLGDALSAPR